MADVLGPDYSTERLDLNGGDFATLVSLPAEGEPRGAMLYIHGFVDYFFQDHVARHFASEGWAWYALDLRRNGRSLKPGHEPWYVDDLRTYYEEIDQSIARIRADGYQSIVLMGHSTGGLISTIWAHDRQDTHPIDALVLNSPWLDLQEPWIMRTVGTAVIRGLARISPLMNVPRGLGGPYAQSIHKSGKGEWDFNTRWKPVTPQEVKMGFLAAVRREQARLHKGMDVGVPVLMVRSTESRLGLTGWHDDAAAADTVLDVDQMEQWLPMIGSDVTDVPLAGALHDVMLSAKPVREQAIAEIDSWLDAKLS